MARRLYFILGLIAVVAIGTLGSRLINRSAPIAWDLEKFESELEPKAWERDFKKFQESKRGKMSTAFKAEFRDQYPINTLATLMRDSGFKSGKLSELPESIRLHLTETLRTSPLKRIPPRVVKVIKPSVFEEFKGELPVETVVEVKPGDFGPLVVIFSVDDDRAILPSTEY